MTIMGAMYLHNYERTKKVRSINGMYKLNSRSLSAKGLKYMIQHLKRQIVLKRNLEEGGNQLFPCQEKMGSQHWRKELRSGVQACSAR